MPAGLQEEYEEEYELPVSPQPQRRQDIYEQRRHERRMVVKRSNRRSTVLKAIILVVLISVIHIAQSSLIAQRGFDIVEMRTEAVKLEAENARLRIANAQLKSPSRIKDIAVQKLGMVVSDQVYFAEGK